MKVIIVGNSIASYTLASALLKSADYIDIEVFSDEPEAPYYRTRILSLLDGQSVAALAMKPALESPRYHLHNVHVDNIDVDTKTVYTSDGGTHDYDVLVLANGAKAFRLPLPGGHSDGIFAIRTCEDVAQLASWLDSHKGPVVVIGGGLLGLEAAAELARCTGSGVTVLESAGHLLPLQLDHDSAAFLSTRLKALGVNVMCKASTSNFLSKGDEVSAVKCDDGFTVAATTVVESVGIRPNSFLAVDAGLAVEKGVVVDDRLQTSAEDVYAIGDVAQFNGRVVGQAGAAMDMARTLAAILSGKDQKYVPSVASSMLKVAGIDVISIGEVNSPALECVSRTDGGIREAFFCRDGVLVGATLIGSRDHFAAARAALGRSFDQVADKLGFGSRA